MAPQTRHYFVNTYFNEYPSPDELEMYHSPEFGVSRLHLVEEEPYPKLQKYIQYLIDYAKDGHIPVFQFNRIDFRLPWIKKNFPGIPILHLHRNPRDQWLSTILDDPKDVDRDLEADPYRITTWSRDLCRIFPFLSSSYIKHLYQRHYFLWKLSYLSGARQSDYSVSYEEFIRNPQQTLVTMFHTLHWEPDDETIQKCLKKVKSRPLNEWKNYREEKWFERGN